MGEEDPIKYEIGLAETKRSLEVEKCIDCDNKCSLVFSNNSCASCGQVSTLLYLYTMDIK